MTIVSVIFDFFNSYHVQLVIAELMFCILLKPRIKWYYIVALISVFCVLPQVFYYRNLQSGVHLEGQLRNGYVVLLLISVGIIALSFKISGIKELLFYCIPAMVIEHLVYSVCTTMTLIFRVDNALMLSALRFAVFVAIYAFFYFFFARKLLKDSFSGVKNGYLIIFSLVSIFIVYGLSVWTRENEVQTIGANLFDSICCMLILLIHFGKFEQGKLEKQNEIMVKLLQIEEEKHKLSAENIALINIKCHDIKHQIAALRHLGHGEQEESIRELERLVTIYDTSIKTGNDTLDALLAEMSLFWENHNVNFTCVADGGKLDFMLPSDIYSLFRNALDNALDSVRVIDETEKRVVSLCIASKGNYAVITISNFFEHGIILEDNLPMTTKGNKDYHGYGLKSIQYIVKKYNGTMSLQTQNGIFELMILMPVTGAQ